MAKKQADEILQQYDQARLYLEQTLAKEAEEKIFRNARSQEKIRQKIEKFQESTPV